MLLFAANEDGTSRPQSPSADQAIVQIGDPDEDHAAPDEKKVRKEIETLLDVNEKEAAPISPSYFLHTIHMPKTFMGLC